MYQAFSRTQTRLDNDELVPDYSYIQKVVYEMEERYKLKGFIKSEGPQPTAETRKEKREKLQ